MMRETKKRNKKYLPLLIAGIVLLLAAAAVGGLIFFRTRRLETQVRQQNYVASRLIEMGDYEQARVLAAQTDQIRNNQTSRQLLVLAAGFQSDYAAGIRYADGYLEQQEDETIRAARMAMADFVAEEETLENEETYYEDCEKLKEQTRTELLKLLLQVQETIKVNRSGESILAMLDMMSSDGQGLTSDALAELEKDDSPLSRKMRTAYAIQTGDYTKAYETAEKTFKENDSFENRALLANLVAKNGGPAGGNDSRTEKLRQEREELQRRLDTLESQNAQTDSGQSRLTRQMENLRGEIRDYDDAIASEPVKRAINFIETTTPVSERATVSYRLELAQLYYQAADRERARELLVDVITEDDKNHDPASMLLDDFIEVYQIMNGREDTPDYLDGQLTDVEIVWDRIAQLLNFIGSGWQYAEAESFYGYVLSVLDELYNGVIIRAIDATRFPAVRVTVNAAMELDKNLVKDNFTLLEMGEPVPDFELIAPEEQAQSGEMSVVLVVDHSGSMGGSPMEDTKKAVSNFVKNVDDAARVGLVIFDDSASVECELTGDRNAVLRAVRAVEADGGTNIYSGLEKAGEVLNHVSGRKIVILLSDGEDGSRDSIDTVLDDLNRKNIYVYSVGFGGADTEYLSYIATRCKGKFIQADSSEMLGEIYSAIGNYMANDYILQFDVVVSPEEFARNVRVSVDVNNAFAEEDYYVGVPYESIRDEADLGPEADYFREVGGSKMDGR